MRENIQKILRALPAATGVYLFKDARGAVLYVGKATSLKSRVSSYFREGAEAGNHKEAMIPQIADIETIVCETEAQALILEAALIKEHKTRYNILQRDDKSFPYVYFTKETFPRLAVTRKKDLKKVEYFGPYLSLTEIKGALEMIRRVFPYRTCTTLPQKACLYRHLGLCAAPCEAAVDEAQYAQIVQAVRFILRGEKTELVGYLTDLMQKAADAHEYERAAFFRDRIESVASLYGGRREFKQVLALKEVLGLDAMPSRIECVDISGIQLTDTCGSLVVFDDGLPNKKEYRRFKIRDASKDDFRMVEEVVFRRLSRIVREGSRLPDLLVIDGGQIQVEFAVKARERAGAIVPIIGLAKKHEEIWREGVGEPLRLPRTDLALRLLQRMRDEAHRFVNTYHRTMRSKRMFGFG
jgi:excinuclease ABC subunit C